MLALAEEKARARGLRNISFQAADAERLPFPDAHFDLVTGRLSLMYCPRPDQALREAYRVLKPAGRAVFLVWGPPGQNAYLASLMGPFAKRGLLPPPQPGAPSPFRFATAGTLSDALRAVGFQQVTEEVHQVVLTWPGSVEQWLSGVPEISPTFQQLTASLPSEQLAPVLDEVRAAAQQYATGQQIIFPAVAIIGSGSR
jgi:ubiquinone/menaquinone biosynthesis C-methylase UbiE